MLSPRIFHSRMALTAATSTGICKPMTCQTPIKQSNTLPHCILLTSSIEREHIHAIVAPTRQRRASKDAEAYQLCSDIVKVNSAGGIYLCWCPYLHNSVQEVEVSTLDAPSSGFAQPHTWLSQQKYEIGHE